MTDADRDRPPVRTPSSVERIEASELESAEVQAAVIAKRLFSLHGRRVALYKQMDTAGSALTSAASSLSSGSGDDAAMGAVPAAVSGYQTTMEGIMRAMADVSQGVRDAEAAAVAIVGSGGSSGCTEAEAVVTAVQQCQDLEQQRLLLKAEQQQAHFASASVPSASTEELVDIEARLGVLGVRVQSAMDDLRDETADAMLSLPG
jgi:hypothetical protein